MHFPKKTKLFFLVTAGLSFIALSPVFNSALPPDTYTGENAWLSVKINPKNVANISVMRNEGASEIFMYAMPSGRWICQFDGMKIFANQHAVEELLSMLGELKFYSGERMDFSGINFGWVLTLTDNSGKVSQLRVAETRVYYSEDNSAYFIENEDLAKHLTKIYPELYCRNLLDEIDTNIVSRIRFASDISNLDFVKLEEHFKVTFPICRKVEKDLFEDTLQGISSINCTGVCRERPNAYPLLFTLEFECGRMKKLIEFHGGGSNFYAIKSGAVYKLSSHASSTIGEIYSKFINFRIFSGIKFDFLDISNFPGNRHFSFQKLESSGRWRKSYKSSGNMVFVDIGRSEIRRLEKTIARFSHPVKFEPMGRVRMARVYLKSNIGELTFDVFKSLDGLVFVNSESSLAFVAGNELMETLNSLLSNSSDEQ